MKTLLVSLLVRGTGKSRRTGRRATVASIIKSAISLLLLLPLPLLSLLARVERRRV
jgi:hypothetical protein